MTKTSKIYKEKSKFMRKSSPAVRSRSVRKTRHVMQALKNKTCLKLTAGQYNETSTTQTN